jgi:ABC-type branched-subunit amino acid transport system substrate-binding protein
VNSNKGNNSPKSGGGKPPETKWWNKNKGLLLVISGACLSLGLIGFLLWRKNPDFKPPTTTSICPSSFETRVTWGGKYLSSSSETIPPVVEQAIENLNKACTKSGTGKNQQKVEDSIPLFEAAKDGFQQAVQQQPQNGQLLAFLHNTKIFLEEAKKAKDTDNYKNQAEVIAVAASIETIGGNDEEELRNLGNSLIIGSLMYLEDLNNQNVILLIFDDQSDTRQDDNVNQAIIADLKEKIPNLLGVIGHALSSVTKIVLSFYQEEGILLITSTSTADDINPGTFDIFKRVVIPNDVIAKGIFETIRRVIQLQPETKVSILYGNDVYGKDLGKQVYQELCNFYGKSCPLDENNQPVDGDAQPKNVILDSIKQSDISHRTVLQNTQVLILIPNGNSRQNIVDLVAMTNQQALIISPDSAFNLFTTQVQDGSCIAEGMLLITPKFDPNFSQDVINFIKSKSKSYQLNNQNIPGWQKLETKDWRVPYSYAASKSILWVNEPDYFDGKSISDGTYIGKIEFDDITGSRTIENNNIENYINEYEVTSECEFERK